MFNRAVYDSLRMSTKSPTVDINYCDSICRGLLDKIQIMPIDLRIAFEATWHSGHKSELATRGHARVLTIISRELTEYLKKPRRKPWPSLHINITKK